MAWEDQETLRIRAAIVLADATNGYREIYGAAPTTDSLPLDKRQEAANLLIVAIEHDDPFADDAAFYEALGLDPPQQDAA